jgi:hypothetical protein
MKQEGLDEYNTYVRMASGILPKRQVLLMMDNFSAHYSSVQECPPLQIFGFVGF